MDDRENWLITEHEKNELIEELTNELAVLRVKASVSQEEISKIIGISRQTYGDIERKKRKMSWSTYLSLILFFDYTKSTHKMIRNFTTFPKKFLKDFSVEEKKTIGNENLLLGIITKEISDRLDERALHAIKTVVMLEYARCNKLPNEQLMKSFREGEI